jgi:N-succinyldiaminopimelate aminotransferase
MTQRIPHLTTRLQGFGTNIFAEMTQLAYAHDAINLGQGYPDFAAPDIVKETACKAIFDNHNQYSPGNGLPGLRAAIAAHQRRFHGLDYDPDDEVTVTAGATEGIAAAVQGLCEVGDEVVLLEPCYDLYPAIVSMAGAVPRTVTLHPPDFAFDLEQLEAAFTPKTRLVVFNTPHNPTGTVLRGEPLEHIARLCVEHDVIAVTDEVYEHLVYDGEHECISSLPGMRERTVQVSSAGKTLSVTGWKVGWACAAPGLTAAVRAAKQWLSFSNGTPFQHAVTEGLGLDDEYFQQFVDGYRRRRDILLEGLTDLGYEVFPTGGSYFINVDIRSVGYDDGMEFCRMLPQKVGVAAIPCSAFYISPGLGRHVVRFAFCKSESLLVEGLERLASLRGRS